MVWVVLVRAAAAALALWLAYRLGPRARRASCGGRGGRGGRRGAVRRVRARRRRAGREAPLVIALALGGDRGWRAGRLRAALALGVGVRAAAGGGVAVPARWPAWWRGGGDRGSAALLVGAARSRCPRAWFVPEWLGSGDVLRSGARARVPNPGQPALADVPALASLWAAAALLLVPLWVGGSCSRCAAPRARALAARRRGVGRARAAMAQAGFSGEPRYALPGVALLAVAGAAGLARAAAPPRGRGAVARASPPSPLAVAAVAASSRTCATCARARRTSGRWRATSTRRCAPPAAARRVLACGRPYVGRYRGPLMAYALDVRSARSSPTRRRARPASCSARALTPALRARARGRPAVRAARARGRWEVLRALAN